MPNATQAQLAKSLDRNSLRNLSDQNPKWIHMGVGGESKYLFQFISSLGSMPELFAYRSCILVDTALTSPALLCWLIVNIG